MLPQLADDANAAKAVGGDRCYLSSPAPSSQIVPSNKAINLIDQHISFTATFMLQLGERFTVLKKTKKQNEGSLVSTYTIQDYGLGFETMPWLFSMWFCFACRFWVRLTFLCSSYSSDMQVLLIWSATSSFCMDVNVFPCLFPHAYWHSPPPNRRIFIYIAQNHKFASKGFTICTIYILYL